jgi:hypothetical protein
MESRCRHRCFIRLKPGTSLPCVQTNKETLNQSLAGYKQSVISHRNSHITFPYSPVDGQLVSKTTNGTTTAGSNTVVVPVTNCPVTPSSDASSGTVTTGALAGGIVGALVGGLVIGALLMLFFRRPQFDPSVSSSSLF